MLIVTCRPNGQSSGEGVGPRPTRPEFDTREGHDSKRGLAAPPDPEWSNNGPLGYDEQSPGHPRTPRDDRENSWCTMSCSSAKRSSSMMDAFCPTGERMGKKNFAPWSPCDTVQVIVVTFIWWEDLLGSALALARR
jgi:hypothetical protein